MRPGETSLKIYCIRFFDRSICTQFDGRSLYKCPCRHNHITVISRHCPRFRCYITVNRCCRLDSLTECNYTFRTSKCYRLNDIVAFLFSVRYNCITKLFIYIRRKNSTFLCTCNNSRCKEKSLIKRLHHTK